MIEYKTAYGKKRKGCLVTCKYCGHKQVYTGQLQYKTCSSCQKKTPVRTNIRKAKNEEKDKSE